MDKRESVCFVSEKNICRSIIAELYLRKLGRQHFDVHSFGLQADRVHYLVIEVMRERGIDPSYSFSKVYQVISNQRFDYVVLMHPSLQESLPRIPYEYKQEVWEAAPVDLSREDEDEIKADLRKTADEIEALVKQFIEKHT